MISRAFYYRLDAMIIFVNAPMYCLLKKINKHASSSMRRKVCFFSNLLKCKHHKIHMLYFTLRVKKSSTLVVESRKSLIYFVSKLDFNINIS